MAVDYEKAGVSLEAGYDVVRRIKKHVASTSRLGVMGNIGAFGGMFDLSALNIKEPILVSGTDGVGTKLKLAFAMDKHDTIGIDAVAMCVNDVLAQGAEPLFFLDYVAVGKNIPEKIEAIVAGVAEGCRQAGCALVGGETAEMPGMYSDGNIILPDTPPESWKNPNSLTERKSRSATSSWALLLPAYTQTASALSARFSQMLHLTFTRCILNSVTNRSVK